jgi:hypothetical protein
MNKRAKAGLILLIGSLALILVALFLRWGNRALLDEYESFATSLHAKSHPSEGVLISGRFLLLSILGFALASGTSFLIGVPLFIVGLVKGNEGRKKTENV